MKLNRSFPIKVSCHYHAVGLNVPVHYEVILSRNGLTFKRLRKKYTNFQTVCLPIGHVALMLQRRGTPSQTEIRKKNLGGGGGGGESCDHNRLMLWQINLHPFDKQWHVIKAL